MAKSKSAEGGSGFNIYKGKYAPESFIIPGQDQNGVSVRLYCRVVPMLDRAVEMLCFSKKFPFKSKGDLMRWCIKRGVESLDEMEPVVGSVLAQVDIMIAVLQDEQANHAFMTVFNTMAATIAMHIQAQAMGEARRVISTIHTLVMKIEDDYWRNRYLTELDTKFGHLLKGHMVEGAGMGSFMDGPAGEEQ